MANIWGCVVREILRNFAETKYPSIWFYRDGKTYNSSIERPEGEGIAYRVERSELFNRDNTLSEAAVKCFAEEILQFLSGER